MAVLGESQGQCAGDLVVKRQRQHRERVMVGGAVGQEEESRSVRW
jgi:hypothetical protein